MITKQQIQDRLKQLEKDRDNLIADINATMGAIQDCAYWLKQLEDTESGGHRNKQNTIQCS